MAELVKDVGEFWATSHITQLDLYHTAPASIPTRSPMQRIWANLWRIGVAYCRAKPAA